jgi:hypothetical protein
MTSTDSFDWRTTSRSSNGENCVQVCAVPSHEVSDDTVTRSA